MSAHSVGVQLSFPNSVSEEYNPKGRSGARNQDILGTYSFFLIILN